MHRVNEMFDLARAVVQRAACCDVWIVQKQSFSTLRISEQIIMFDHNFFPTGCDEIGQNWGCNGDRKYWLSFIVSGTVVISVWRLIWLHTCVKQFIVSLWRYYNQNRILVSLQEQSFGLFHPLYYGIIPKKRTLQANSHVRRKHGHGHKVQTQSSGTKHKALALALALAPAPAPTPAQAPGQRHKHKRNGRQTNESSPTLTVTQDGDGNWWETLRLRMSLCLSLSHSCEAYACVVRANQPTRRL